MSRHPLRRFAGALVAAAVAGLSLASPAGAAASGSSDALVQLRAVNSLNPAQTSLAYFDTGSGAGAPPTVTLNGQSASAGAPKALGAATPRCIAVVFDTSTQAQSSSTLESAKAAVRSWIISRKGAAVQEESFSIYMANETGTAVQSCTNDTTSLTNALDQVKPSSNADAQKKTAIWAAVQQASADLQQQDRAEHDIVIATAQGDNASGKDKASAVGGIATAEAAVFGLVYTGGGYSGDDLRDLSGTYGGELLTSAQGAQVGSLVEQTASTIDHGQYSVTFDSKVKAGTVVEVSLTSHGSTSEGVYTAGQSAVGLSNLSASANAGKAGVSLLQGGIGLFLAILLIFVAVSMLAYGVFLIATRDDHLTNVLQPYSEGYGPAEDVEGGEDASYAKTAIIQRAVEMTEQIAESQGYLARAEAALERANLPLRAGEALFFYAAVVAIATIVAMAVMGFVPGLVIGVLAALIPLSIVSFLANRRRKKFLSLLPDTLQLLSGTLRAGYSLMQGVEAISQEVEDPMGQELRRVVTEARLGRPLEESLEGVAERMASPDFSWSVMAIRIQREVGGNLSELLLTVAETMTQRERLRRDIAALTAEGRISALVLACLPIGLGVLMWVINPEYMSKLTSDTLGWIMLGLAGLGIAVGFLWMRKIINIEI